MDYKSKYIKYKNKYLDIKSGGYKNSTIVNSQTSETDYYQTKFIKGHGTVIAGETFLLPEGCNVITLTDVDVNVAALEIYDAIIKFFLSKNIELFKNNNSSYNKTLDCEQMEKLLNMVGVSCNIANPTTFNIRNHVGPIQMNEMGFEFTEEPCDINKCSIDLYNPLYAPLVPYKENVRLRWNVKSTVVEKQTILNSYYLSELIEKEGKGTYIIRSCRKIANISRIYAPMARQISNETPVSERRERYIDERRIAQERRSAEEPVIDDERE